MKKLISKKGINHNHIQLIEAQETAISASPRILQQADRVLEKSCDKQRYD